MALDVARMLLTPIDILKVQPSYVNALNVLLALRIVQLVSLSFMCIYFSSGTHSIVGVADTLLRILSID